ncbi:MAG: Ig-like domain-containing protein [Phycisphaerae bacterium]|nr:Ig-like domain-containing protein [Phycisphaerae bacterium]
MTTRHFLPVFLLLLGCLSLTVSAGELLITAPKDGAAVKEGVTFTVEAKDLPELAMVEWRLNGRTIASNLRTPPTFAHAWHPAEVFDGPMTLQAIGRDKNGKEIAVSPAVRFAAAVGPGTMKLDAPTDLSKPLSGTVTFTATAVRPLLDAERKAREEDEKFDKSSMNKTVEALMFFVDGAQVAHFWASPTRSTEVDTTRLPNGEHELLVTSYAWFKGTPPIGMLQATFITDNGRAPMAVLPRWTTVSLKPEETADLAPLRLAHTDGHVAPLEAMATYKSADPAVATVDEKGKVTAVAKGMTTITMELPANKVPQANPDGKPFTASVLVFVGLPNGTPHFTRDGKMLVEYDPKRSRFVRSYFMLNPRLVLETPDLAGLVKDAGVNTCESGFFHNPADGGGTDSLEKYIANWDAWFEKTLASPLRELEMGGIFSGDDWVRTRNELTWTANTPWSSDLAKHIWTKLRDSGVATAIEMMDEASFLGHGPANGWWTRPEHADAGIPADALTKLIDAIKSVENHTPISWPVLGLASPEHAAIWMGDPTFCDYTSQYWTTMGWRRAYPWNTSGPQMRFDLKRVMIDRFPLMQWDRPQLMLVSGCGTWYFKKAEGFKYQPGVDVPVIHTAAASEWQASQPYYAAISGGAGVRVYNSDFMWRRNRERAEVGSQGRHQTGASPFGDGSDRWHALSAAFNLIGTLEPYLLQPKMHAVALGPDFDVDARLGKASRLLMAINWSQRPRTTVVDVTPYVFPGAETVICYRGHGGDSSVELLPLPAGRQIKLTFQPGEFVALVLKGPIPPAVRLVLPREMTITGPLELLAEASGVTGAKEIKQVEFFVNGKSIGAAKEAPFKATWDGKTTLPGEWHGLKAVATDTAGLTSEARAMVRVAP